MEKLLKLIGRSYKHYDDFHGTTHNYKIEKITVCSDHLEFPSFWLPLQFVDNFINGNIYGMRYTIDNCRMIDEIQLIKK